MYIHICIFLFGINEKNDCHILNILSPLKVQTSSSKQATSILKTYIRLCSYIHTQQTMAQLPKNIDVSKLRYSEVRSLNSGAKTVYVNYGTDKLTIQTPVVSIPYGLSEPYKVKEAIKKGLPVLDSDKQYNLTVSFKGMDENPKIKAFHDKLKEIETKVIDDAFTNRLAWFKKDYDGNKSLVSTLFSPLIKIDKDPSTGKPVGKYPPTFTAKLPYDYKTNSFNLDSYDMENNELSFQDVMNKLKGARTQLIVQMTGIWIAGGMFGCSWKVISAKFQLHQNSKITFIEDSDTEKAVAEDSEDDDIVDVPVIAQTPSKTVVSKPLVDEDDDEDEEEEEEFGEEDEDDDEAEPEVVPEPPKPVKKAAPVVDEPKPVKKVAGKKAGAK